MVTNHDIGALSLTSKHTLKIMEFSFLHKQRAINAGWDIRTRRDPPLDSFSLLSYWKGVSLRYARIERLLAQALKYNFNPPPEDSTPSPLVVAHTDQGYPLPGHDPAIWEQCPLSFSVTLGNEAIVFDSAIMFSWMDAMAQELQPSQFLYSPQNISCLLQAAHRDIWRLTIQAVILFAEPRFENFDVCNALHLERFALTLAATFTRADCAELDERRSFFSWSDTTGIALLNRSYIAKAIPLPKFSCGFIYAGFALTKTNVESATNGTPSATFGL
ncbi:hypothetical protein OF83DRAFT_1174059 [Amylostereum chailletii]|nr:hypothetical protein OF83DRAFT_1174059 [Amylostereum chailletii]